MGGKLAFVATCLILVSGLAKTGLAADLPGIPPEVVADYLHAVIEADRTFYTIHIVDRMQKQGGTPASETWRKDKTTLPLPAQFLREAGELATLTGTRVRYRLMSLWPINPQNAPASNSERNGMEAVRLHPERSVCRQRHHRQSAVFPSRLRRPRRNTGLHRLPQCTPAEPETRFQDG